MKGFEIDLNGKKIDAAIDMGVISIIVENDQISVTGRDAGAGISIVWGRIPLNTGDRIVIRFLDNAEYGSPETIKNINRKELVSEYYALKRMLTENGVLK